MKPLSQFKTKKPIEILLTDIDGTLTDKAGKIPDKTHRSLWQIHKKGIKIIPVTGRPAGWCEMIARTWPVHSVIGENGAFYFYFEKKQLKKTFKCHKKNLKTVQDQREELKKALFQSFPEVSLASDQFCRLSDLAIDIGEAHSLEKEKQAQILSFCQQKGAQAKMSSIHINAWFGSYDKLSTSLDVLKQYHGLNAEETKEKVAFIGDSPNDAPMFAHFPHSVGVANISRFTPKDLGASPTYLSRGEGAQGFASFCHLLANMK